MEIYCYSYWGPWFGGGNGCELTAYNEPFNGDRNCCSYADKPGYGIPIDADGNNMLTN